jgi:predicted CoA-binding protein
MIVSSIDAARALLASGRIAVVGVSRDPKEFSRYVLRELLARGIDAVPVSPVLAEAEGRAAAPSVRQLTPAPEAALILVAASRAAEAVRDCVAAGVRRIWLHRGGGPGATSDEAIALCRASGVEPILGLCPFMALPGAAFPHRLHGRIRRALGRRPQAAPVTR